MNAKTQLREREAGRDLLWGRAPFGGGAVVQIALVVETRRAE